MKTTVIYHSADFDGIFCREIARKFLPDSELIGWNFGDPLVVLPADGRMVYVLDLSPDCLNDFQSDRIIWIDHHKTSIEKWPSSIPGYRIDGVAACRLAWQWFTHDHTDFVVQCNGLPDKQAFIDRTVSEPLAVRLAGEYDIWDKRDPQAETFQYGLRIRDLSEFDWAQLLSIYRPTIEEIQALIDVGHDKDVLNPDGTSTPPILWTLLEEGKVAQRYAQSIDANLVKHKSYRLKWEGLDFLVLNTARFNSLTFAALDVPETGHDALLGYMFNGKVWTVSLYHAKHRTDLDLSAIAVKHGGGGHKGACGMTFKTLPPFLIDKP